MIDLYRAVLQHGFYRAMEHNREVVERNRQIWAKDEQFLNQAPRRQTADHLELVS